MVKVAFGKSLDKTTWTQDKFLLNSQKNAPKREQGARQESAVKILKRDISQHCSLTGCNESADTRSQSAENDAQLIQTERAIEQKVDKFALMICHEIA